ncbi:hypothetical protein ANCCEY_13768 [Ancylostoma ceylanicum]|uniref:Globin family profile domain-containing protein n=1 Tax=Ancylostoma ceylanicum TaxID=53326 RepID=A0A0D6L6S4_9BILA|nr:hypothetical protein ANCCEY_13768 [Ancylostoma ceylanicum]
MGKTKDQTEYPTYVLQRIFEKRSDYQKYVYTLGKERAYQMSVRLKDLVEEVVAKIFDPDHICAISRVYGEEHVELKAFGFKPDFWVTIADAITVEGVILDMANHQPADTVAAWSQLVTMMFSAVRDGYYSALRKHRMSSRRGLQRQITQDSRDAESNVETVPNPADTVTNHQSAVRSVSMYAVAEKTSENGTLKKTNGSVNVMAPVANPPPRNSISMARNLAGSVRTSQEGKESNDNGDHMLAGFPHDVLSSILDRSSYKQEQRRRNVTTVSGEQEVAGGCYAYDGRVVHDLSTDTTAQQYEQQNVPRINRVIRKKIPSITERLPGCY